ncbi:MAG: hypothetical protein ACRDZ8_18755 [Acidimicrobiales bacterium]
MTRAPLASLALAVALATAGLVGCAGPSITLGTNAGACFRALPPAEMVVHKGRLVGVRRISTDSLQDQLPNGTTSSLPDESLCLFAFSGTYPPGSVTGSSNGTTGRYAVVAVGTVHLKVAASFVLNTLPTRFRHLH